MPEEAHWSLATWEGSRRRQHEEFYALSFREKVKVLEELDEIARVIATRPDPPSATSPPPRAHD